MQYAEDLKDVMMNAPRTASSFVKRRYGVSSSGTTQYNDMILALTTFVHAAISCSTFMY